MPTACDQLYQKDALVSAVLCLHLPAGALADGHKQASPWPVGYQSTCVLHDVIEELLLQLSDMQQETDQTSQSAQTKP